MSRLLTSLASRRSLLPAPRPAGLRAASSSFLQDAPAPPRLPASQQAEFERLQRAAEAALSSHNTTTTTTTVTPSSPVATSRHVSTPAAKVEQQPEATVSPGTFSAGMRKGAPPEFEGEQNPRTGEVGGPKNEPLRWGSEGDWSYNGRVTDF
ncbi:hypothetical protein B0T25DRAFT_593164 [Lasiosphaeria hispida]|uniref:Succinate dehydrogenase assembly factor 4, mitochondrial n=1 Tax=Lasiosphaeria hispida TaxID=260671 RepID=A0AAJ0H801_9PEZI|nr:hypothetical protein B0T25DRAFT_593164 [Lasiosphaeria hispida]